jgi:hypothetical protein
MRPHRALAVIVVTMTALLLPPVSGASAQATFATCEGAFIPAGMVNWGT